MIKLLLIFALAVPFYAGFALERPLQTVNSTENTPYYFPDGMREYPHSYNVESSEGLCVEPEKYPGIAYENSVATTKIVTTVFIGAAFVAVIAIALTNTPGSYCHSTNSSCH